MADVPSSTSRKSKKRKKNAKSKITVEPAPVSKAEPPSAMTETLEDTLFWYNGGSDETSQNLAALKLEVLGPFLFSRDILCNTAVQMAKSKELLPKDSPVLPMFFEQSLWSKVTEICTVMSAMVGLCDKDHHVYESLLGGTFLDTASLVRSLRKNCSKDQLKLIKDDCISHICDIIIIQGANYGLRAKEKPNFAVNFFRSLTDKVKLVDPVKDRGNTNFKQLRFKAAIADYSTAIKLCPFSPVLYCNRALCYLKNEDFWNACVDSYRALILHPTWEKPYYRCAEAWHKLGRLSFAIEINKQGQALASSCADLISQLNSFTGSTSTKVKHSKDAKSESATKAVKEKPGGDTIPSTRDKTSSRTECTEFEKLQCPELDPRISCGQLRKLCDTVKLEWCSPASYLSAAHQPRWEDVEPEWIVPIPPSTDALADREPMMARFDEIWCPVLADVEESLSIIPPTFQYFSDGTVMHSAVC